MCMASSRSQSAIRIQEFFHFGEWRETFERFVGQLKNHCMLVRRSSILGLADMASTKNLLRRLRLRLIRLLAALRLQ